MKTICILSDYVAAALATAVIELLEDGSFSGSIPLCPGVVAFGDSAEECRHELQATLEDWLLLGLKLGQRLPVVGEIDLNEEPQRESLGSL